MRRTKREAERTRQTILASARRVFARHGVTRTTIGHIARESGVTRGAVYWHFANKQALFGAMRDQVSLPLFDPPAFTSTDESDPLSAIDRFLRGLVDQIRNDLQTRRTFEIMSLKCEYVDELRPELRRHLRRCHELRFKLEGIFERARKAGTLRQDVSPELAALNTCVFITGLLRLWLMDADGGLVRPNVGKLIAGHVDMLRGFDSRQKKPRADCVTNIGRGS